MNTKVLIWASILAGDFGRLEESAVNAQSSGADALHVDIMDGHFVPNLSMGIDVVKMLRRCSSIPLNVHLMMTRPDLHVHSFIEAGADWLSIHVESQCNISLTLRQIKAMGAQPGLAINPETPPECVFPFLSELKSVLCMTVHPGFGGQRFIPGVLSKITAIYNKTHVYREQKNEIVISVDGGIDIKTGEQTAEAGANALVSGSALFKSPDMAGDIQLMRNNAEKALARRYD